MAALFLVGRFGRLDPFERLERRALGAFGLAQRRHAGLVQGRGAEAPALVPQPQVLFGAGQQLLMFGGTRPSVFRRACMALSSGVIFRSIIWASASAVTVPSLNCCTAPRYALAVLSSTASTRVISGRTSVTPRSGTAEATATITVTAIVIATRGTGGVLALTPLVSTMPQMKPAANPASSAPPPRMPLAML